MAKVVDGELIIFEGDVYRLEGDTLVFIESKGEEDESFRINNKAEEGD